MTEHDQNREDEQENVDSATYEDSGEPLPADDRHEETPATPLELDRVRELVLAANPDVVPEMVQGSTFDDLLASVNPARAAYQRIVEESRPSDRAPRVAAQPGGRGAVLADVEALSPLAKIRKGLRRT